MISCIFQVFFLLKNYYFYKKNKKERMNFDIILNSSKFNEKVSILIPAWNESKTIKRILENLKQNIKDTNVELILIAGGTDNTFKIVEDYFEKYKSELNFNCLLIEQPPLGKNNALNLGLQRSIGEIIVILDADCFISHNWLKNLVQPFSNKDIFLTYGTIEFMPGFFSQSYYIERNYTDSQRKILSSSGLLGCNFAIRRKILERIGNFNPKVYSGVDLEFSYALAKYDLGKRYFSLNAKVITFGLKNFKSFVKKQIRIKKAKIQFWKEGKIKIIRITPFLLAFYFTFGLLFIFVLWNINSNFIYFANLTVFNIINFINQACLFLWIFQFFWILFRQVRIIIIASIFAKNKKLLLSFFSLIIYRFFLNILDSYILIYYIFKKDVWKEKKTFDQERYDIEDL